MDTDELVGASHTWAKLSSIPQNVPSTTTQDAAGSDVNWTLRLLPGTNCPTEMNVAHDDRRYPDKPTVHEYLALQAVLLQNGEEPVDVDNSTWLDTTSKNEPSAPYGNWNTDDGVVRLSYAYVFYRSHDFGVRQPVWGE